MMADVDSKPDRWSLLVQRSSHIWCLGTQALVQNFPWVNDCVWSIKHPRQFNVVQKKANAKSTIPWKNSNISLNFEILFWRIYKRTSTCLECTVNIFIGLCMCPCCCQKYVSLTLKGHVMCHPNTHTSVLIESKFISVHKGTFLLTQ